MAGIFYNGAWWVAPDFLPTSGLLAGGVFDSVSSVFTPPDINPTYARFGGKGIGCAVGLGSWAGRSFGVNLASGYAGFGFNVTSLPASGTIQFATLYDATAGAMQVGLGYNSTGQIGFYSTGGLPGGGGSAALIGSLSATGTLVVGAYPFIEVFYTIANSGGALTLKVNNSVVISFSGDTQQTANAYASRLILGGIGNGVAGGTHYFDDIYLLDGTGASPFNTFLGNGRAYQQVPTSGSATGGLNAWTATSPQGTDWGNCANIPLNTAQNNAATAAAQRMSLRFGTISASRILGFNSWYSLRESAAGPCTVVPIYRSNSVDQVGPVAVSPGATDTYYNQVSTIDPNTGLPWASGTVAAAYSSEFGLRRDT